MEKSQLNQLVQAFSNQERREIRRFLASPFFNQRQDVIALFDQLAGPEKVEKAALKRTVFGPKGDAPDSDLRLRMTYLMRLLEQFIALKTISEDENAQKIALAEGLRKRGLGLHFDRVRKNLEKNLADQPLRDGPFHRSRQRLFWEVYQLSTAQNPTDATHLRASAEAADAAWLTERLRLACLLAAHKSVYKTDYEADFDEKMADLAAFRFSESVPSVAVYLDCFWMLRRPDEPPRFQNFKKKLLAPAPIFAAEEMHGLFIMAINHCVRQINAGDAAFLHEALALYKSGLEQGFLFENGQLSRYSYFNIAAVAIQTGDLEWARFFIIEYRGRLEKRDRDAAFSFNSARLEQAASNHGAVMELLQRANYRDPLLNLAAKTLLLKTYFELGEHDLLASHLDAMRNYIHRKRVLGYHRENYLNIIRFTEKLLRRPFSSQKDAENLRLLIEKEATLTERAWLLEQLGA